MEYRRPLTVKIDAFRRYCRWHGLGSHQDDIYISEFPKSGGTWVCQLVSAATGVFFPRNRNIVRSACVIHSHLPVHSKLKRPIAIIRDGRDIMVSAYFHFVIGHRHTPGPILNRWRRLMKTDNYDNITENLSQFIRIFFTHYSVGGTPMNWVKHCNAVNSHSHVKTLKYENLINNPTASLRDVCQYLGYNVTETKIKAATEFYSFERQTGRLKGQEDRNSFLRNGTAGDWVNYFNKDSCLTFDKFAGEMLIDLGYEENRNWIDKSIKHN